MERVGRKEENWGEIQEGVTERWAEERRERGVRGGGWEARGGGERILMSGEKRQKRREGERMNDKGEVVNCSRACVCLCV